MRSPKRAERLRVARAPAEQRAQPAGGPEQAGRLQPAALEVALRRPRRRSRRRRAASARRGRARTRPPTARAPPRSLPVDASSANAREKSRSPVAVAASAPAGGEDGGAAAPQRRPVEHVVVHERRHVQQLHRRRRRDEQLPVAVAARPHRNTSIGRRRLPPAESVAAACRASSAPWPSTTSARRASVRSSSRVSPGPPAASTAPSCAGRVRVTPLVPRVDGDDPAGREHPAHVVEAGGRHAPRPAPAGPGKRRTRAGQVGVGVGVAGEAGRARAPPGRTRAGRTRQRRLLRRGDLEDHHPPARAASTRASSARPRVEVGEVARAEADRHGVELARPGTAARARCPVSKRDVAGALARAPARASARRSRCPTTSAPRARAARPPGRPCRWPRRARATPGPTARQVRRPRAPAVVHARGHDRVHAVVDARRCGRTSPAPASRAASRTRVAHARPALYWSPLSERDVLDELVELLRVALPERRVRRHRRRRVDAASARSRPCRSRAPISVRFGPSVLPFSPILWQPRQPDRAP